MYFDLIALKSLDLVDFAAVPTGPILARIFWLEVVMFGLWDVFLLPKHVYLIPFILFNGISGILILKIFLDLYFLLKIWDKTNSSFSPISNKYFGSHDVMEIDTGEYLRFMT